MNHFYLLVLLLYNFNTLSHKNEKTIEQHDTIPNGCILVFDKTVPFPGGQNKLDQ